MVKRVLNNDKKAAIEIQFNWVFVLIVGTVILIFFISIVQKQKDISEKKLGASVITDLESLTTGAKVSKDTSQIIKVPDITMKITSLQCERKYSVGGSSKEVGDKILFSPTPLIGRIIVSWTLDWSSPFRITNFLYFTNPKVRYIIVGDDAFAEHINKSLPSELYKEFYSFVPSQDNNNYKVKFVFVNMKPMSLSGSELEAASDESITAINITSMAADNSYGDIHFFVKNGNSWSVVEKSHYLGEESLFGAVFAENKDIYNCNMREAFKRMRLVSRIYANRTLILSKHYISSSCQTFYDSARSKFESLATKTGQQATGFPTTISDIQDIYDLGYAANGIDSYNNNIQLLSCPELY